MWREAMGQTWNGDLLHDAGNIGADVVGFFAGPPGDPGRIRQTASSIEALRDRYEKDRLALNDAVDELTRTWTGDSASQFSESWREDGVHRAPARVLEGATATLDQFVRQLRDYADQLEHAQHEHWIQLAMVVGLTVVNAAQLGADPATDGAEVAVTATTVAVSSITFADIGALAIGGAFLGLGSDLVAQVGADIFDLGEGQLDQTRDHIVPWLNGGELAQNALLGGPAAHSSVELCVWSGGRPPALFRPSPKDRSGCRPSMILRLQLTRPIEMDSRSPVAPFRNTGVGQEARFQPSAAFRPR